MPGAFRLRLFFFVLSSGPETQVHMVMPANALFIIGETEPLNSSCFEFPLRFDF